VSKPENNVIQFQVHPATDHDLSDLLAEGMTLTELIEFIVLADGGPMLTCRLSQLKEPEEARQFTYRLWLVRRALARIDWEKAVVRNDAKEVKVVMGSSIQPSSIAWLWPG
jgi:hypothetical protein